MGRFRVKVATHVLSQWKHLVRIPLKVETLLEDVHAIKCTTASPKKRSKRKAKELGCDIHLGAFLKYCMELSRTQSSRT